MNKILSYIPGRGKSVVRIVRLQGTIKAEGPRSLNLRRMERFIDKAFDIRRVKPKAVCLEINSVGGTVVQSNLIYERIRYLSEDTGVPVLSFAEEYAASGGYWLAMAGDEIYVDPNSMLGSIGVLFGNFGFEETMKKLGKCMNICRWKSGILSSTQSNSVPFFGFHLYFHNLLMYNLYMKSDEMDYRWFATIVLKER